MPQTVAEVQPPRSLFLSPSRCLSVETLKKPAQTENEDTLHKLTFDARQTRPRWDM